MRHLNAVIASMSQNTSKDGNYHAYLYRLGKNILYVEDIGTGTNEYILDIDEREAAKENPEKLLRERVSQWASRENNPLAFYAWGIFCLEDDRVGDDFIGDCVIVKRGNFDGGLSPISYVTGKTPYPFIFKSAADAQAWIDKKEHETYFLSHSEVPNPDYFIIDTHVEKIKMQKNTIISEMLFRR